MLIVIKYGPENAAERGKVAMAFDDDEIVLLQNGAFWAVSPEICALVDRGIKVYVIESDLYARGYTERESFVPLITYDGMIDIIERQEKSMG